mmetsp:Transcript_178/g.438  ORF Transcript_178/g.438 Transcript_178/m.438 type:complete len:127 (+) Transcript_178:834-1214(+)
MNGCNAHDDYDGMSNFVREPASTSKPKAAPPIFQSAINYHGRILLRQETLRQMGVSANDKREDLFICKNGDQFEVNVEQQDVKFNGNDRAATIKPQAINEVIGIYSRCSQTCCRYAESGRRRLYAT